MELALTLRMLGLFYEFCRVLTFFQNYCFQKKSFRDIIRVSNGLKPVQARHFCRPDLGSNCLHRLSADDIGSWAVKESLATAVETILFNFGE